MSVSCYVFAVIAENLEYEIIKKIILKGETEGFLYHNKDLSFQDKSLNTKELINYLYNKTLTDNPYVYSSTLLYMNKYSFYLGFANKGATHFQLADNEFEIKFSSLSSVMKKEFRNGAHYIDLNWYTQALLNITDNLPIARIHTIVD